MEVPAKDLARLSSAPYAYLSCLGKDPILKDVR
jgi:hypothetical protein